MSSSDRNTSDKRWEEIRAKDKEFIKKQEARIQELEKQLEELKQKEQKPEDTGKTKSQPKR